MSGISEDEKYEEFVKRTQANLKIIEFIHSNPNIFCEVYEVTQLVNSMLGLLILPHSAYEHTDGINIVNDNNKEDFIRLFRYCKFDKHYPFRKNDGSCVLEEVDTRPHLTIKHIRNACAHFGIYFENKNCEISKITFKDHNEYWKKKYCRSCNKNTSECEFLKNNFTFSVTIPIKADDETEVLKSLVYLIADSIQRLYKPH